MPDDLLEPFPSWEWLSHYLQLAAVEAHSQLRADREKGEAEGGQLFLGSDEGLLPALWPSFEEAEDWREQLRRLSGLVLTLPELDDQPLKIAAARINTGETIYLFITGSWEKFKGGLLLTYIGDMPEVCPLSQLRLPSEISEVEFSPQSLQAANERRRGIAAGHLESAQEIEAFLDKHS